MLLLDVSQTSHCTANSGIQRVCRSVLTELKKSGSCQPVVYDPYYGNWRAPVGAELERVGWNTESIPEAKRHTRWSISQKIYGHLAKIFGISYGRLSLADVKCFITPETFSDSVGQAYPALMKQFEAPSVAIFMDAIAEQLPQFSTQAQRDSFKRYTQSLLQFDGIACISNASKRDLLNHWERNGVKKHPPAIAIPLATLKPDITDNFSSVKSEQPVVLIVGTIEPRKNHAALIDAVESLWNAGYRFSLHVIGASKSSGMEQTINHIRRLQREEKPIKWDANASDADVLDAYRECDFVVYPSLYEGYGLPVIEALSYGKPVITTPYGSLPEVAADGGCLMLNDATSDTIAKGIKQLLEEKELYTRLCAEATNRKFRSWADYTKDLLEFADELKKSSST